MSVWNGRPVNNQSGWYNLQKKNSAGKENPKMHYDAKTDTWMPAFDQTGTVFTPVEVARKFVGVN